MGVAEDEDEDIISGGSAQPNLNLMPAENLLAWIS
jgi:hypothetical protein